MIMFYWIINSYGKISNYELSTTFNRRMKQTCHWVSEKLIASAPREHPVDVQFLQETRHWRNVPSPLDTYNVNRRKTWELDC